jgi:hypothetical protein
MSYRHGALDNALTSNYGRGVGLQPLSLETAKACLLKTLGWSRSSMEIVCISIDQSHASEFRERGQVSTLNMCNLVWTPSVRPK